MTNPAYAELLAVLESDASNRSLEISGKRRDTIIEALRIAAGIPYEYAPSIEQQHQRAAELVSGTLTSLTLMLPHQRIADLLSACIDTPAGDWLRRLTVGAVADRSGISNSAPWYGQGAYWSKPDAAVLVTVDNPVNDDNGETLQKRLTLKDFIRALALMAGRDYGHHFADFLRENEDSMTGDLFMQLAVYGEEVFA